MTDVPATLKARVPTLTEVLELPEVPDLGDEPVGPLPTGAALPAALSQFSAARGAEVFAPPPTQPSQAAEGVQIMVESLVASLGPQVDALVSSRLRDVLAPTIQEAVEEAIERLRQPLIEALQVQLREQLERALSAPVLRRADGFMEETVPVDTRPEP